MTSKSDVQKRKWRQKVTSKSDIFLKSISDVQKWTPEVMAKSEVQKWSPKLCQKVLPKSDVQKWCGLHRRVFHKKWIDP